MSLFKSKEWWRTDCGTGEIFDRQSLLVAQLFGPEKCDIIVVGSHSGNVRIYCPSSQWIDDDKSPSGYKFTDLMIEANVDDCIIDMKAGKFVSGSQDLRLAILTPSKLIVYGVGLSQESSEHGSSNSSFTVASLIRTVEEHEPFGDRCVLEVVYEHELPRFPASLTTGPFGAARGRDFFCVQCLDGTLLFYEQEAHTFGQTLKNRLLPESMVYVSRNDVFVTTNSGWILECYRYQNMAESGRNKDVARDSNGTAKSLEPDWIYNLGEAVLGIEAVTLSSFEVGIVVLAERNLYCFRDNCTALKYSKRLEYNPVCFRAYVIEPDGKLMVLVVADTDTLLLYEGTTLKWSAQLPFTPVAIARAHFQHLEGVIVILSEEGRLEACYLGAEPSLFIAPPLHRRGFDYKAAENELLELRKQSRNAGADDRLANTTVESELIVAINVSKDLEPCPFADANEETEGRHTMCRVSVDLSSYTPLHDVQVNVEVAKPLLVNHHFHVFPTLSDRQIVQTMIYINGSQSALSSEVIVTASYETANGHVRVLRKIANLPLRMFLRACPPENTASFTATIKNTGESLVNFSQLFPEFIGEHSQRTNSNALGLQNTQTGSVVTIVAGTSTNRYRIQSNDPLSMTLVLQQLVSRLQSRYPGSYVASIGQNHLQLVQSQIEAHFASRQRVKRITNEIGLLTTQLRNIERRILRGVRERNSRSLAATGLPTLLDSTYRTIFAHLEDLTAARANRERAGHDLHCALRLLLLLLRLNVSDDKYAMLESAIGFEPQLRDDVDWEEVADVALGALLRHTSRKSDNSEISANRPPLTWNKFETARDISKLKKRVVHVVERLNKTTDIAEVE